jgi:hypothetical protein
MTSMEYCLQATALSADSQRGGENPGLVAQNLFSSAVACSTIESQLTNISLHVTFNNGGDAAVYFYGSRITLGRGRARHNFIYLRRVGSVPALSLRESRRGSQPRVSWRRRGCPRPASDRRSRTQPLGRRSVLARKIPAASAPGDYTTVGRLGICVWTKYVRLFTNT